MFNLAKNGLVVFAGMGGIGKQRELLVLKERFYVWRFI